MVEARLAILVIVTNCRAAGDPVGASGDQKSPVDDGDESYGGL